MSIILGIQFCTGDIQWYTGIQCTLYTPQSYGTPPVIWHHTVLPATRHRRTLSALPRPKRLVLDYRTLEGWKAELT